MNTDHPPSITVSPIALVRSPRVEIEDDDWGGVVSEIVLADEFEPEAFEGIEAFSHVEVIYWFHRTPEAKIVRGARHLRNNPDWPKVGIFAQRGKNRPNRLGVSISRLLGRQGRMLTVQGLDAIDGTPVLDVKPVMREFLPTREIRQPDWSHEIMREYWSTAGG